MHNHNVPSLSFEDEWPQDEETQAYIREDWHPHLGDRSRKLAFIGKNAIIDSIRAALEKSLLTDEECGLSAEFVGELKNPFDGWNKLVQANEFENTG